MCTTDTYKICVCVCVTNYTCDILKNENSLIIKEHISNFTCNLSYLTASQSLNTSKTNQNLLILL